MQRGSQLLSTVAVKQMKTSGTRKKSINSDLSDVKSSKLGVSVSNLSSVVIPKISTEPLSIYHLRTRQTNMAIPSSMRTIGPKTMIVFEQTKPKEIDETDMSIRPGDDDTIVMERVTTMQSFESSTDFKESIPTLKLIYESRGTPVAPTPSDMLRAATRVSDYYMVKPMAAINHKSSNFVERP